jgi:hypothetical protein
MQREKVEFDMQPLWGQKRKLFRTWKRLGKSIKKRVVRQPLPHRRLGANSFAFVSQMRSIKNKSHQRRTVKGFDLDKYLKGTR